MEKTFWISDVPATVDNETLRRKVERAYNVKINSVDGEGSSATLGTLFQKPKPGDSFGIDVMARPEIVGISFEELENHLSS